MPLRLFAPSRFWHVGQCASATVLRLLSVLPAALFPFCAGVPAIGVGHPVDPLPDVRRPDARSAQIRRRSGVASAFQVSANMVEPRESSSSGNLLAKDACRAALADEVEERRP